MSALVRTATVHIPADVSLAVLHLATKAVRVDRVGRGPGSLTNAGLHYGVVGGSTIQREAEDLWTWATTVLVGLASATFGEKLVTTDHVASRVNVNVLNSGDSYELHYDSNPVTAVLFLTTNTGGELRCHLGTGRSDIRAVAGTLAVVAGNRVPHEVLKVQRGQRITMPVSLRRVTDGGVRDKKLDAHLYGGS